MTILFDARRPVKSARRAFGAGITTGPAASVPSPEDRAWWAAESARLEAEREARELEIRALASYATDALCLGLTPCDTPKALAWVSLAGRLA
jgi:hypothetical protein